MQARIVSLAATLTVALLATPAAHADTPKPQRGFFAFGPDQTIVDIAKLDWAPLQLEGLPAGIEIASLRGQLAAGGGEILLRVPPGYVVPNHSHTSDEVYLWLQGSFTYVAADGTQQALGAPAYISLPGNTPHALHCGASPCVFYLRYGRPFDLQVHPAGAAHK